MRSTSLAPLSLLVLMVETVCSSSVFAGEPERAKYLPSKAKPTAPAAAAPAAQVQAAARWGIFCPQLLQFAGCMEAKLRISFLHGSLLQVLNFEVFEALLEGVAVAVGMAGGAAAGPGVPVDALSLRTIFEFSYSITLRKYYKYNNWYRSKETTGRSSRRRKMSRRRSRTRRGRRRSRRKQVLVAVLMVMAVMIGHPSRRRSPGICISVHFICHSKL